MSWLNINQSLNSLKGQITNFATEVLSEGATQNSSDNSKENDLPEKDIQEKCREQELEIASLKKLTDELQTTLQSERLSRRNGVKEDESSWYWDPPPQASDPGHDVEKRYKLQIQALQNEISTLTEREPVDTKPDTEEEINRLREENRNLTTNLEDLDNQHQLAMERLLTLKKELQKNFEVLKHEHEDLKNANEEYANQVQSFQTKLGERDEEIKHLVTVKADYDTLHHKYLTLEKIHSLLRENAEKFQEENQDLHEEVFKLQEQVTKLEHEIEISTKHSELSNVVPRETYDELIKELNDLKERRKSNQVHLDEINIDDNAKSVIETLKRDINELKHKLTQQDPDYQGQGDHRTVKSDRILQLYNKYINFELPVDYTGEMFPTDDNIALNKLESVFKTINLFKKDIDTLEHQLSEKNHTINHLQTQIDDITSENDFLTTDIQHFERELNEMKKNNDFLISEIAALKNTSKLEPIIETHEDNLAKLETELDNCNMINKTFESEIKRIEKELSEVKTEKTVLQESLNDLKNKYTSMLIELEKCKTQTEAVEALEDTTITKHTEKLKNASDEIDDLKKRLNASNAKNEQLSIDIHIVENDKVLLTKEVDDLKRALEDKSLSHKELETLKTSVDIKLQELEIKHDTLIKHKEEIENNKFALEEKVTTLESELSSNRYETTELVTEKMQLSENLNHAVKQNSALEETVQKLTIEISNLRENEQKLLNENSSFKNSSNSKDQNNTFLQKTIDDLTTKVTQLDVLNNEILSLKVENRKLSERKLQMETELSSTDRKILHLEQEFEKLLADLNDKDSIIDDLNNTVSQNNFNLSSLNQNVTDLQKSLENKNQEIKRLTLSLQEITDKFNDARLKLERSFEELNRLHNEKEDISNQVFLLTEEVTSKNIELLTLTDRLGLAEKTCAEHKVSIDKKDKEIKELNQSILELTDKIKTADNTVHQNDDYTKLVHEKEIIEKSTTELRHKLTIKENEWLEMKAKCDQFEMSCVEHKAVLDNATKENAELINLITLKHNESIQYHNEIQRLNQVILEHANEFKHLVEENEKLLQNASDSCSNCERLKITLREKDEIIMTLNQSANEYDKVKTELLYASETIKNLTEKCDNLDRSLATQLETVKNLTAENVQLSEQEQSSTRELERLRHHLVELEENYTQELMTSEQKLTECQARLHQVEERAKQTSTVYTSNSIRANQEVETLRNQIKLLEKQREDVQARLGEAEDARSRSEAALTNLQVVLEQFQLDKERDIQAATEKIKNKMEDLKRQNNGLQDEIGRLNTKLTESLAGLQAASRLGDQLETKTAQINDLKEQVRALQVTVAAAEERYGNAVSNQQDKVDKDLVKNLVINYVMTAQNSLNKTQVLRVLSTVLDFNQKECERLGLSRAGNAPDSLAAEFVKFLQNESKPRAALPSMMNITQPNSRSTTPTSRKSSTAGPQPSPSDAGHKRNTSTGSNNLLFQNIDSMETSSQISAESDREVRVVGLDTGVNQTRNTEGAILKYVLKDM